MSWMRLKAHELQEVVLDMFPFRELDAVSHVLTILL